VTNVCGFVGNLQRKKGFKKSIDQDDARRRREEMQIQIRKNKREESVNQRRRIGTWFVWLVIDALSVQEPSWYWL